MFWQAEKMGGLRCGRCCSTKGVLGGGSNSTKEVLGAGQVKRGVFTAAHTCTGHICECLPLTDYPCYRAPLLYMQAFPPIVSTP